MFNTHQIKLGSNSQTVQFNTPSTGMMQRSHPKSRFVRFQKGSEVEKKIFPLDPGKGSILSYETTDYSYSYRGSTETHEVPVTVLQILVFGDDYYLCEVVQNEFLVEEIQK